MGWGNGGSSASRMRYQDCANALNTARDKSAGKPLKCNLRVFDRGTHYAIHYYRTDIVRYYPDGSVEITTGYHQRCTLDHIGALTGHYISNTSLPLVNGRKPYPEKYLMVQGKVFSGKNGYLRFDQHGNLDPASVKPIKINVIKPGYAGAVRAARAKAKAICDQILLRYKLGVKEGRYGLNFGWIQSALDIPLDQIDYSQIYPANDPHKIYAGGSATRWFAEAVGAYEEIDFV